MIRPFFVQVVSQKFVNNEAPDQDILKEPGGVVVHNNLYSSPVCSVHVLV